LLVNRVVREATLQALYWVAFCGYICPRISGRIFESFLVQRTPFDREFTPQLAHDFYVSVRCGVLHEARTKNGWTIQAKSKTGQVIDANLHTLYRDDFQASLLAFVEWYEKALPSDPALQEAFVRKFNDLCV